MRWLTSVFGSGGCIIQHRMARCRPFESEPFLFARALWPRLRPGIFKVFYGFMIPGSLPIAGFFIAVSLIFQDLLSTPVVSLHISVPPLAWL